MSHFDEQNFIKKRSFLENYITWWRKNAQGSFRIPTSNTSLLIVPALSATYIAPLSVGSASRARIFEGIRIGFPAMFVESAALRSDSEIEDLRFWIETRPYHHDQGCEKASYLRGLEEIRWIGWVRHGERRTYANIRLWWCSEPS